MDIITVDNLKIKKCPHCGSLFIDKWIDPISEEEIADFHIRKIMEIEDVDYSISGDPFNRKVEYKGIFYVNNERREMSGQFFIRMSFSSCPTCTLRRGNYYEAILQLRGGSQNDLENALSFSVKMVNDAKSRDIFITRSDKRREGYDLLISDKQYTRNMGKRLVEEFGGTYTETSHLVGRKEGQDVYRITVSVRIPLFHEGDLLKFRGDLFMVGKIRGSDVILHNLLNDQIIRKKIADIDDFQFFERRENIREATFLYREGNTVYVLDPYDNKEKAISDRGNRKKFYVVRIDDDLILVPFDLIS